MISIRNFICALFALGLFTAFVAAGPFSNLVVFGDSLSDVGNISQATWGAVPGSDYFEGRFSNGPVYVEALAAGLGLDPITHSLANGNDFAYGGAKTSGTELPDSIFVRDIDDQVAQFLNRPAAEPDELFLVFAGANDLLDDRNDVSTPVNHLANSIGQLIDDGARQFLVPNLPPLGYTPRFNDDPSLRDPYNMATMDFNAALDAMLDGLEAANADVTIHRFDVAGLFNQVIFDPAAFGLTNVTDPAHDETQILEEQDEYLFYDDLHPTRVVHAILAQHMLSLFVLAGDYNGNGVVDAADYTVWRDAIAASATALPNDPTPGVVDENDFLYWRDHFGQSLAGAASAAPVLAAVPEPTSGILFIVLVLGPFAGKFRRPQL